MGFGLEKLFKSRLFLALLEWTVRQARPDWIKNADTITERERNIAGLIKDLEKAKREICALREENEKLLEAKIIAEQNSKTDPLTNLLNVRGVNIALNQAFHRALRFNIQAENSDPSISERQTLVVLQIDLDRFKSVNDQYGHEWGDLTLQRVSKAISTVFARETDIKARPGGEELLVAFVVEPHEGPALERALQMAEKLRAEIEASCVISSGGKEHVVTASIGVATCVPTKGLEKNVDGHIADTRRKADFALYKAKSEGRNRVCYADPETGEMQPSTVAPGPSRSAVVLDQGQASVSLDA